MPSRTMPVHTWMTLRSIAKLGYSTWVLLDSIRAAGLTLKPEKCSIGMSEVQYLGRAVGNSVLNQLK